MLFTFIVTAFYNTELGLEYGILASILVLVWQITSVEVSSVCKPSNSHADRVEVTIPGTKAPLVLEAEAGSWQSHQALAA